MIKLPHDLKFSILKPFILKNFLDGDHIIGINDTSLVNDSKRSIADHFGVAITDLFSLVRIRPGCREDTRDLVAILVAYKAIKQKDKSVHLNCTSTKCMNLDCLPLSEYQFALII